MKLNTTIKTLCAAVALATSAAASATPFYLDIGTDYSVSDSGQVTPTSTSVKNEMLYTYESSTTIFDVDGSATMNAGDFVTTSIGLPVGDISNNYVTGFNPGQVFGANSNNGYGTDWMLSFGITGLNGIVTGTGAGGVPLFAYGPGAFLNLYLTFDGVNFNNFMDIAITGGTATGLSTVLFGNADFTNVDAGYNNLFHTANGVNCNGATGFFDMWSNCSDGISISFEASQDTNVLLSQFIYTPPSLQAPGMFNITSNHDGSITPTVPEPASIALTGLALLGLGAIRRRKSA